MLIFGVFVKIHTFFVVGFGNKHKWITWGERQSAQQYMLTFAHAEKERLCISFREIADRFESLLNVSKLVVVDCFEQETDEWNMCANVHTHMERFIHLSLNAFDESNVSLFWLQCPSIGTTRAYIIISEQLACTTSYGTCILVQNTANTFFNQTSNVMNNNSFWDFCTVISQYLLQTIKSDDLRLSNIAVSLTGYETFFHPFCTYHFINLMQWKCILNESAYDNRQDWSHVTSPDYNKNEEKVKKGHKCQCSYFKIRKY